MSFILDALRKAERDRSLGQAPRIEDVALARDTTTDTSSRDIQRSRAVILVLLILVIGGGTYLLLHRATPPAPAPEPAPLGIVTATVRGPAPVAATFTPARIEPENDAPPALTDDGSLATLDDLDGSADGAPPSTAEATAEPEIEKRPNFVAHPTPTITALEPEPAPAPVPQQEQRAAAPSTPATRSSSSGTTLLDDMPNDYRADFPTLSVEVHVWDSSPAKRFVMVNGRRYHEGDTLAAGPRLAEIAQDGLILDYHGSRVLLSLLQ